MPHQIRKSLPAVVLAATAAGCATGSQTIADPTPAPVSAITGAFVVRLGTDTLSVERYTRTEDSLVGDAVMRSPQTAVRHYVVRFGPDGRVTSMDFQGHRPSGSAPPQAATILFGADTVNVTMKTGDSTRTLRVSAAGAVPFLNFSYALIELAVMRALATPGDSSAVTVLPIGGQQSARLPIKRIAPDSVRIWFFGYPIYARIDESGRILGLQGLSTTQKVEVERVATADIEALVTTFASRDASRAMGQLSPRDSVSAAVGSGRVTINYGRPFKRGRKVLGGIVPWDTVWRTGANAATGFTTDVDLVMGGVSIPAGKYTLWTIPSQSGWKLVVNKQTGQWGTEYDVKQDLARIEMRRETLAVPVEQFTISLEPSGSGGVLSMSWDDTRVFVPFSPKS
ncbi:MAG: DUF2911 domain-containing protein [Gemmatimonadaceae bacterium]